LLVAAFCLSGFSKSVAAAYLLFYSFAKVYQHSAHRYTLGPLDYLIISPPYHRLHHAVGSRCNYGISVTLFDLLFGTARWPAAEVVPGETKYGIARDEQLPFGFWPEMLYFLRGLAPRRNR